MELTRERIEIYANAHVDAEIRSMAKQLLAEMDKPKVWTNAPDNAIIAQVHFYKAAKTYATPTDIPEVYTREPPKSRIDEIAENCWHEINKGMTGLPVSVIKSAIIRALEEKETN